MRAREFLPEQVNPEVARPDFHMTDTITVGDLGPLNLTAHSTGGKYPPQFIIDVSTPEGQRVGYFRFIVTGLPRSSDSRLLRWMDRRPQEEPQIIAGNVNVNSRYQRKGVARAVYQWVKNLGNDIVPSSTQTAAGRAMWQGFQREPLSERQTPTIRGQILDTVQRDGGKISEYFVRFTDIDKMGFSDRQRFKRHLDVDAPGFTTSGIGNIVRQEGRRALWFYPLREYLKQSMQGQYAMEFPYVWLVRIRSDAWLQPVGPRDKREIQPAPAGRRRVGILKGGISPQAVFFEPAFDVVGKFYDYAGQHQRHGQVQGRPEPTFFDRVRGNT